MKRNSFAAAREFGRVHVIMGRSLIKFALMAALVVSPIVGYGTTLAWGAPTASSSLSMGPGRSSSCPGGSCRAPQSQGCSGGMCPPKAPIRTQDGMIDLSGSNGNCSTCSGGGGGCSGGGGGSCGGGGLGAGGLGGGALGGALGGMLGQMRQVLPLLMMMLLLNQNQETPSPVPAEPTKAPEVPNNQALLPADATTPTPNSGYSF